MNPNLVGRPPHSKEATTVPKLIDPFRLAVLVINRRGAPYKLNTNILPITASLTVIGKLHAYLRNPCEVIIDRTEIARGPPPGILTLTAFPFGTGVTTWTRKVERSKVTLLLRPPTPETCIFVLGTTLQSAIAGLIAVPTEVTPTLKLLNACPTTRRPLLNLLWPILIPFELQNPNRLSAGNTQWDKLRCGLHPFNRDRLNLLLLLGILILKTAPPLPLVLIIGLLLWVILNLKLLPRGILALILVPCTLALALKIHLLGLTPLLIAL